MARADAAGLAAAQKNRAQWDGTAVGYDFVIAEQCARYDECRDYVDSYGEHVLAVEYRRRPFRRACRVGGDQVSVVGRDWLSRPAGPAGWCAT